MLMCVFCCVTEVSLCGLQCRLEQCDSVVEFSYLETKTDVLQAIIHMYGAYRDHQRKLLQVESTNALREVLHGSQGIMGAGSLHDHSDPSTDYRLHASDPSQQQGLPWQPDELEIHMVPSPITPIRDIHHFLSSPRPQRSLFCSTDLAASVLSDFSEPRDM